MRGRARRRQDKARMKKKAIRLYGKGGLIMGEFGMEDREAIKLADHLHPCSCAMGCGHHRKLYGRTRSEVFADMRMKEEIAEDAEMYPRKRFSDESKEEDGRGQGEAA